MQQMLLKFEALQKSVQQQISACEARGEKRLAASVAAAVAHGEKRLAEEVAAAVAHGDRRVAAVREEAAADRKELQQVQRTFIQFWFCLLILFGIFSIKFRFTSFVGVPCLIKHGQGSSLSASSGIGLPFGTMVKTGTKSSSWRDGPSIIILRVHHSTWYVKGEIVLGKQVM